MMSFFSILKSIARVLVWDILCPLKAQVESSNARQMRSPTCRSNQAWWDGGWGMDEDLSTQSESMPPLCRNGKQWLYDEKTFVDGVNEFYCSGCP